MIKYPYLNIIKLFENEKYPWEYDFKNENTNEVYQKESETMKNDVLYKFALYKNDKMFDTDGTLLSPKKKNKDNEIFTCQLAREVYRKLFEFKDKIEEANVSRYANCVLGEGYGPDTINTFMDVGEKLLFSEFKEKLDDNDPFKKNRSFSKDFLIHTVLEKKLGIGGKEKDKILKYLNSITTIGNYCLVPAYFNPFRGTKFKDYFDLSLVNLKCKKNSDAWNCKGNIIDWQSEHFNNFINEFFLWDYVKFTNNTYDVKDMFDKSYKSEISKSITKDVRNNSIDENTMLTFIDNAVWSIKRRGFFMTLLLEICLADYKKYTGIKDTMKKNNICNMNDAINFVLQFCNMEKLNIKILDTFDDDIYEVYLLYKKKVNVA